MARGRQEAHWLAGNVAKRHAAFRSEYLDFERGIRVGHLEPEARITQLLKARLTDMHECRMVCDRWGRGVYWQWICWVPEPNRAAKPFSSIDNFASSKFFITIDEDDRIFQSGLQVERAPTKPVDDSEDVELDQDWDWYVLLNAQRGEEFPSKVEALLEEGFRVRVGAFSEPGEYAEESWDTEEVLRDTVFAEDEWGGFQLFWPMSEEEVKATPGPELIDAISAVFAEISPVMNLCMYSPCLKEV